MMSEVKAFAKKTCPDPVWNTLHRVRQKSRRVKKKLKEVFWEPYLIKTAPLRHRIALRKLEEKTAIRVAFFLINTDTWKCDSLYWAFEDSDRFEPTVVICPFVSKGEDFKKQEIQKAVDYCESKGFRFTKGYNERTYECIDIKSKANPDIVLFTNPNPLSCSQFRILNYICNLTCYIPYSFRISELHEYEYNSLFVNLTWKNFWESEVHLKLSRKYARNAGANVEALGFPHLDKFRKGSKSNPWNQLDGVRKRVIWAPHWTIKGQQTSAINWSCFLKYHEQFIELAEKYKEEVQFALKPHPFLRPLLEQDHLWGKTKTKEYIQVWKERPNLQYVEGSYVDLFLNSDALIHDSGSFMVEYLMVDNPVAYTFHDRDPEDDFNAFGEKAFEMHIPVQSENELERFVTDVIASKDRKKDERADFVKRHLDLHERSAGEKIVDYLASQV